MTVTKVQITSQLHVLTAGVCLFGLLVKHLRGQTQIIGLIHQRIQFLPSLKNAINCLQNQGYLLNEVQKCQTVILEAN